MKKKNKVIPVLLTGIALAIGIAISNAVIQNSFVLDEAKASSTYSTTITSKVWEAYGSQTLSGVSWTAAATGGAYWGYDATKGQQFGSSGAPAKPLTLSTSGISGAISSITIGTSGASSVAATLGVTVGGSAFGGSAKTITSSNVAYTFTGSASGDIVFTWTQTSSKALYLKSISIEYSTKVLSNISVTGTLSKTSYYVGESFSPVGLTITANYSDTSSDNVTANCTFSPNPLTIETTSVTASYTELGVTKTATIDGLTVNTRNLASISVSTNPSKMNYIIGESFSSTGMVITATYDAGDPVVGYTNYSYSPTAALGTAGAKTITITSLDNASITTSLIVQVTSSQSMSITVTDTGATISGYQTKTFSKNGSTFVIANIINTSGNIQMQANTFSMHNSTALAGYLSKITIHKASGTPTSMTLYSGTASQESSTSGGTACVFNSSTNTFSWDINASLKHTYFRLFNLLGSGTMTFSSIDIEYLLPPAVDDDAIAYGTSFLSATASGCSTASSATLSGVWADLESSYNALSSDAKAYLTSLTPNASGNDAEHAVARYIHIITKYGEATFVDFMNLDIQAAPTASNILDINSNDFLPLISVIGIIGLTVIIGYYYHNKKKEA